MKNFIFYFNVFHFISFFVLDCTHRPVHTAGGRLARLIVMHIVLRFLLLNRDFFQDFAWYRKYRQQLDFFHLSDSTNFYACQSYKI